MIPIPIPIASNLARRWRRLVRIVGVLVVIVLVILLSASVWLPAIGRWLDMPAAMELRPVDAIIVNGGSLVRTLYGAELYRHGLAPELWHTGYARGEAS